MFQKFWIWLSVSSADENKVALTIKGGAVLIPVFAAASAYIGKPVSPADFSQLLDSLVGIFLALATLSSGLVTAYGLLRKIYLTVTG